MIRHPKLYLGPLVATALLSTSALAQDTTPRPQSPPAPQPTNGALLGGELGVEVAAGAAVLVGIAVAIAGDDDETAATTTSTR